MFDHDPLQYVSHIFHRVGGFLEHFVNLLPANQVIEIILVIDDFDQRFT
jgi:hypothetical protein